MSVLRNSAMRRVGADARASDIVERVREGLVLLDDAIIELADRGEMFGLAGLVAERLGIAPQDFCRAVAMQSEQLLTVLCRAAGLNINAFSAVLRMRCRARGAIHSPVRALAAFHDMPAETARRMLRVAERP